MLDVFPRIGPRNQHAPDPGIPPLQLRLDRFENCVEVRELAGLQFGINFLPIDADLKGAAARGHEFQGTDSLFQGKDFFRQTDGLRFVVSSRAIFDGDFRIHVCNLTPHSRHDSSTRQEVRSKAYIEVVGYPITLPP